MSQLEAVLSGNYMVASSAAPFYETARVGTRVLEPMHFLAYVTSHLQEMFNVNPTVTESFLRQGKFILRYPPWFRNFVSPQCAPRSENPEDYVIRQGHDGICRAYLKRHPGRESEQVWIGGMTREVYLAESSDELDPTEHEHVHSYPSDEPLIVITYIYGDMLYPIEQLPGESMILPPSFERALEMIKERGENQEDAGLRNYLRWIGGYIDYALNHNRRFSCVAD